MLLLCIAPCLRIVAVHCTLPPYCCCALHVASEVVPNKVFAKPQSLLAHEDVQSGTSDSQHIKSAGTKLQNPSLVSSADWRLNSMVHLQQALSKKQCKQA